jgi:hypothetical protein
MSNPDRYRCPQCRTRRTDPHLMVLHVMDCMRPLCFCGAYTYPHRYLGGDCFHNADAQVKHASRAGTPDDELRDVAAAVAFSMPGKPAKVCPF